MQNQAPGPYGQATGPYKDGLVDVDWTNPAPTFKFHTEVGALATLDDLGSQLRSARRQVEEVMRYMRAAVLAAREPYEDGEQTTPTAIIGNSGLSRRKVYQILNLADET
jgi:hypothetical protein